MDMSIEDLRDLPQGTAFPADLCIVGAGVAGFAIALQFIGTDVRVVMVESGGHEPDAAIDELSEIESTGTRRAPQSETRTRVVGGTSSLWSGRCGVFDPIDYAARPWVPYTGWPISEQDVQPYYDRAGAMLGLGPSNYRGAPADAIDAVRDRPWDRSVFEPVVFQFSVHDRDHQEVLRPFVADGVDGAEHIGVLQHAGAPKPTHFGEAYSSLLESAANITLLTNATATELVTDVDGGRVSGVEVASLDGHRATMLAPTVVLCCGGIDNARLLLASRRTNAGGVGNRHDTVGRFLTDHPFTEIASYHGEGSTALRRRLGHRWLARDGVRHVYSMGARLSTERQRAEGLLNGAVHIVERGSKGSALREAKEIVDEVRRHGIDPGRAVSLARVAARPDKLGHAAYERYVLNRPSLAQPDRVQFGCVVEQVPDPDSRVTLSSQLDRLGMPRANVCWMIADDEFESMVRIAELFEAELRRLGFELPDQTPWRERGVHTWRASVHDMAHPMGATRMSTDPRNGVVDRNCQVHGVDGLFVAGSSVFTTSGYMNPTLMLLALSLRLADHLQNVVRSDRPSVVVGAGGPSNGASAPIETTFDAATAATDVVVPGALRVLRVGIVGAGARVRGSHLPVLRALHDEFDVVGIVGGPNSGLGEVEERTGVRAFASAVELVAATKPDLLIVAVTTGAVDDTVPQMVDLGVPLLFETPFSWNVRTGRASLDRIRSAGRLVAVCEQTPFLPIEQLRQQLIELGLLGRVHLVQNDGAYYDHHGIGALRRLLGGGRRPVRVVATRTDLASGGDNQLTGTVFYDDGATLHHRSAHAGSPGTVTIQGSTAYMIDDTLFAVHDEERFESTTKREMVDGRLAALVLRTPDGEVRWANPFADHGLDDDQIGVATVLRGMRDAVLFDVDPPYPAAEGLLDMDMITAFGYSADRDAAPIALPRNARLERLKVADLSEFTSKLRSRLGR